MHIFLPIYYTLHTRLKSNYSRLAWVFTYVIPLLITGYVFDVSLLQILLLIFTVYVAYEIGYIYNDCELIKNEKKPTIRLSDRELISYEKRKKEIYLMRFILLLIVLYSNYITFPQHFIYLLYTTLSITLLYVLYNSMRNNLNLLLYSLLVWSRYFLFFVFLEKSILLGVLLWVVYPLNVSIEFATKERFFTSRYIKINNFDKYRVYFYLILSAMATVIYHLFYYQEIRVFFILSIYFFVYRLLSFLFISESYRK